MLYPGSTDYVYTQEETLVATPPGKESITNHTTVLYTAHQTPITTQTKVLYHTHVLSNITHVIFSSTQSIKPSSYNSTLMNAGKPSLYVALFGSITVICGGLCVIIIVQYRIIRRKRKFIPPKDIL